ncbi:MAG: ribonuclease III [Dehalococcoidia bacterium]
MADLSELQRVLGVEFHDPSLLRKALTHSSYLNENPDPTLEHNERLEFLGDAVLGYVVAQEIYLRFPSLTEGQLTEVRAGLVRAEALTEIASGLRLGDYLHLGRGEEAGGGRERSSNLARALEAVIGAILLDQGLDAARSFILAQLEDKLRRAGREGPRKDYKSQLQERAQARWRVQPTYATSEELAADGTKRFTAVVMVDGRVLGSGDGPSKRTAQRHAAREALERLGEQDKRESP